MLQTKTSRYAGSNRLTYLKFDLSNSDSIGSAKLRLFGRLNTTDSNAAVTVGAYAVSDTGWSEGGLTWNNKPAIGGTALSTARITDGSTRWYEWDLTDYLREQKQAGARFVTIALKNHTETNPFATFNSDEAANDRPELLIDA